VSFAGFTLKNYFSFSLSFLDGFFRTAVLAGRAFLVIRGLNLNIYLIPQHYVMFSGDNF
jgi:hypothetical protein